MRSTSASALVVAVLVTACSLETSALSRARDGSDGGVTVADGGRATRDGGDRRADGGGRDGGPPDVDDAGGGVDAGTPDAGPAFERVFTLDPGALTCPSGWIYAGFADACREVRTTCGDEQSSIYVDPGHPWQEVRGFVRGRQGQTPDAFDPRGTSLDDVYVDGVSITVGTPRRHVWTFAAGLYDGPSPGDSSACPCNNGQPPPPIVGDNWTCETGNDATDFLNVGPIYLDDVLWDADGDAHGAGCVPVAEPGWFEVTLPAPTTDPIEVRIMSDSCDDNVVVTDLLLEVR